MKVSAKNTVWAGVTKKLLGVFRHEAQPALPNAPVQQILGCEQAHVPGVNTLICLSVNILTCFGVNRPSALV